MSLINQMLKDLDARTDGEAAIHRLPSEVRILPKSTPSRLPLIAAASLALLLAAAYGVYQWMEMSRQAPSPVAVAEKVPPVAPTRQDVASSPDAAAGQPVPAEPRSREATPGDASQAAHMPPPILDLRMSKAMDSPAKPETNHVSVEKTETPVGNAVRAARQERIGISVKAAASAPSGKRSESARVASAASSVAKDAARASAKSGQAMRAAEKKADNGMALRIEKSASVATPREAAEAEYHKAVIDVSLGRREDAIERLQKALRDNSLHSAARQLLVRLLLESGDTGDAMRVLDDGLREQPAQIGWAMSLARLQAEAGDLAAAWKTLDRTLPAAGDNADYQGFAAHILHRLGRFKDSAEHYQAAIRLSPRDGRWWLGLGLAFEEEGMPNEAREAFLRARQSGSLNKDLMTLVEQKLR